MQERARAMGHTPKPSLPFDEAEWCAAIVEFADEAIVSIDLQGVLTSWNPAAERIYGYTASEAIGEPNTLIVPPDRLEEEERTRRLIEAGQVVPRYNTIRVRKDGVRIDVSVAASPLRDKNGQVVGISKISYDVTERRRIDRILDESVETARRLAAIVESTDDAIIGLDLSGTIRAWNRAAEQMYGYTSDQAIGRPITLTLPRERASEESELLERIRRGERIAGVETIRCRSDKTCFPVSLTISPIYDEDGTVVGASKIARDITERKHASERAAFLAEAAAILAASLDYETTLTAVANLAVPVISDWCAVDVLNDDHKLERVAVAHVDPAKIELARSIRERYDDPGSPFSPMFVIRTGTPALAREISDEMIAASAHGDETRIRMIKSLGLRSFMVVPLTAHGRTFGTLTFATAESGRLYTDDDFRFVQDVAFRAALAVDNARAYRQAQEANRLKDEFLATLSHELRTPLNAIHGYTRLLQAGMISPERGPQALATVERNAASLTQIVEDILDVSRIISGKIRLNIQPVDLADVLKNAVETVMPAADAKQIRIQTMVDPQAGPISGDAERLQQVVWNLVSNAVKFTPKHGIVQVRLERINSHVEIVVSDTGIGIAPDFIPHMFERFRQEDSGTTRAHGGIGLGLAIVRHLVELHGGTINATSGGKDTGSTFRVRLPLMIIHSEPAPERRAPAAARAQHGDLPRLEGLRVFAVDDDADARNLIAEALQPAGATVTTADSVAQALEMLPAARPDVLLADIGMSDSDGFELIRRVRQSDYTHVRELPAAALTAYARAEDRVKTLQAGFQMHLAKPVDPAELIVAVAALAKRRSASQ